jgi:hypothetical protein
LVRIDAICTRWKRFGTFSVQSSTVMRANSGTSKTPRGAVGRAAKLDQTRKKETPADAERRPGSSDLPKKADTGLALLAPSLLASGLLSLASLLLRGLLASCHSGSPPWLGCSIAHRLCVFATSEPNSALSLGT